MRISTRVRFFMEQNRFLQRWVEPIRQTKIMKYRNNLIEAKVGLQVTKDQSAAFKTCYEAHRAEFEKTLQMLEDNFSRRTLQAVIDYRLDPRGGVLESITVTPQYFLPDIFGPVEDEVFIDGGAYSGETILDLISVFGGGKEYYKKIYAWEPDPINYQRLTKNCKKYKNIEALPFGMWSKKATLLFKSNGNVGAHFAEDGTLQVPVDSIDNLCSDEKVTFIKMDIEGSEVEALHGAEHVIKRDKPRLAICIYHKPEHLYEIPLLIKEMVPEYKLYVRHHTRVLWDTVLYAVCSQQMQ